MRSWVRTDEKVRMGARSTFWPETTFGCPESTLPEPHRLVGTHQSLSARCVCRKTARAATYAQVYQRLPGNAQKKTGSRRPWVVDQRAYSLVFHVVSQYAAGCHFYLGDSIWNLTGVVCFFVFFRAHSATCRPQNLTNPTDIHLPVSYVTTSAS